MILLRNVPFERQAKFLLDNILPFPDGLDAAMFSNNGIADFPGAMQTFHKLLTKIYTDASCIETSDDNEKYTELINTLIFLQSIFVQGTVSSEKNTPYIKVEKPSLQKKYKKGNLAFREKHVKYHGLTLNYQSAKGDAVLSLRQASTIKLSYPQYPDLIPAVKYFVDQVESTDLQSQCTYNNFGVFIKGDLATAFGYLSPNRNDLDPYRYDILRTVDSYKDAWRLLVNRLLNDCKLQCSGFMHYHASPSWSVSFYEGRKKPLIIFTLGSNIVFIEFTLPVEAAENIILERKNYSTPISERIEKLHCVNCPKQCKGANIRKIDGITLCTGRAEARRIYVTLRTQEDFASVHAMLDAIYT